MGRSRGCEGCKGCFSKGCEWLGLGNRLRRFPKGFWGMAGYGREIGWGTRRVAGNRSVRGGRRRLAAGGGLRPPRPAKPKQGQGGPPGPLPLLCARFARPPPPRVAATSSTFPRAFPPRNRSQQAGRGWDKPGGSGGQLLRSQHNHRDQAKEQDQQPHNHAQHDPDRLVAGGGRRLGQRLPVLG